MVSEFFNCEVKNWYVSNLEVYAATDLRNTHHNTAYSFVHRFWQKAKNKDQTIYMGKGFSDPHYLIVSGKWYNNIRTVMHNKTVS
jgi:hypothetical protein